MPSTEAVILAAQRSQVSRGPDTPLYRFRLSDEALESLRTDLKQRLSESKPSTLVCAGFCLYGAHAFCRWHRGGPWSWDTILQPLGLDFVPGDVYDWVQRGLTYWQRDIVGDSRREWLKTLVCEGGLPNSIFLSSGTSLTHYFRHLLSEAEAQPQETIAALAERADLVESLPSSLRTGIVYRLATEIVEETIRLRQRLPIGDGDVLARLESIEPQWREFFPVQLNLESARALLAGLLAQETRGVRSAIAVEMSLSIERRRLTRRAVVERDVLASDLARQFNCRELPNRFRIHLSTDSGARLPLAIATSFGERFRLEPLPQSSLELPTDESFELVASVGDQVYATAPAPGGEPIPSDAPWVFGGSTSEPVFLGAGSVETRRGVAWLSLPVEATRVGYNGETLEIAGRNVTRVEGLAEIELDGENWSVRTGAAQENSPRFEIRSTPRPVGGGGTSVYLGLPRLWSIQDRRLVRTAELEWRSIGRREWHPVDDVDPIGDVVIRQKGVHGIRARLRVLPSATTWKFGELASQRAGTISFGFGNEKVRSVSVSAPGVESDLTTSLPSVSATLAVRSAGPPPRQLSLDLGFANGAVRLLVPFPTEWRHVLDWQGRAIPNGTTVSVQEMRRLRVVIQTPETNSVFTLRARGTTLAEPERLLARVTNTQSGERALELETWVSEVEAMLGGMDRLDDTVQLRVCKQGVTDPGTGISVGRYDARLGKKLHDDGFVLVWKSHHPVPRGVVVKAASFSDDLREWRVLAELEPGQWLFRTNEWAAGAYLVAAEAPLGLVVRPIRVTRSDPTATTSGDVSESGEVASGSSLGARARLDKLTRLLEELKQQPNHLEWANVVAHLAALSRVPAPSLDLSRAIVRHPAVLVGALLRDPSLAKVVMTSMEALPFRWRLIPIAAWRDACVGLEKYYEIRLAAAVLDGQDELPTAQDFASAQLRRVLETLVPQEPGLYLVARAARKVLGYAIDLDFASPVPDRTLLQEAKQRMFRRDIHALHNRWPTFDMLALAQKLEMTPSLTSHDTIQGRLPVMNAPELAAWAAASSTSLDASEILDLRRCEAFDEDWFEKAYLYHLARILTSARLIEEL